MSDDDEKIKLTQSERIHLLSLVSGQKVFHLGRCSVEAVAIGWQLVAKGLAIIDGADPSVGRSFDMISITQKGRAYLGRE